MFTDDQATPARVEMLLDLARSMQSRKFDSSTIQQLLQPTGLPGLTKGSNQYRIVLNAAKELDLVKEQDDAMIRPTRQRDSRSAHRAVLDAIDDKVLRSDEVEPWFALFYAFLLGRDEMAALGPAAGTHWENRFERELFGGTRQNNRFNESKYRGLRRWFRYSGLGWHDGEECFHPNPYQRLERQLPAIFNKVRDLSIDLFMDRLSELCPELDGGHIFLRANRDWDVSARTVSLGLSHALVDLHLDGAIELNCPLDSDGWSIAKAAPPYDGKNLKSDRVASVRMRSAGGARTNG
ncbi:hypothetical protein [Blastomonas sp. AAP25]|uniref:hypothetical protein n=1 Tax=Blastomonas sp. AAP25 TaxID=1523416 RepID=UPI0006B8B5F8|nr:hypothetical protein [Blastomonas sp. AAP25]